MQVQWESQFPCGFSATSLCAVTAEPDAEEARNDIASANSTVLIRI
jgi:hypothetical protein